MKNKKTIRIVAVVAVLLTIFMATYSSGIFDDASAIVPDNAEINIGDTETPLSSGSNTNVDPNEVIQNGPQQEAPQQEAPKPEEPKPEEPKPEEPKPEEPKPEEPKPEEPKPEEPKPEEPKPEEPKPEEPKPEEPKPEEPKPEEPKPEEPKPEEPKPEEPKPEEPKPEEPKPEEPKPEEPKPVAPIHERAIIAIAGMLEDEDSVAHKYFSTRKKGASLDSTGKNFAPDVSNALIAMIPELETQGFSYRIYKGTAAEGYNIFWVDEDISELATGTALETVYKYNTVSGVQLVGHAETLLRTVEGETISIINGGTFKVAE